MTISDANGLSTFRQKVDRGIEQVASLLPTVRSRLFALVTTALVPALVILAYDEWLTRDRGYAALTDMATRVVALLERELDVRIDRGAHRLGVLAADPEVAALSAAATRELVEAVRDDRPYNNVLVADGRSGDIQASAVPLDRKASARDLLVFQRVRRTLQFATGAFLPEPATNEEGLNMAAPVLDQDGRLSSVVWASLDLGWVSGFIERAGLPAATVLTVIDDMGIVQYRSIDPERYVGKPAGAYAAALGGAGDSVRDAAGLDGVERLYVAQPLEFRQQRTGSRVTLGIPLGAGACASDRRCRRGAAGVAHGPRGRT